MKTNRCAQQPSVVDESQTTFEETASVLGCSEDGWICLHGPKIHEFPTRNGALLF